MPLDPAERLRLNEIADRVWEQRGKVAIANMRSNGVRDISVHCTDLACNHSVVFNVDPLPDDYCFKDLEPRMRCSKCGRKGVSIQPLYWVDGWGGPPQAKPWPSSQSD